MKDELIDILDEQGNKTGQTMMKSKAHDEGLWHMIAHLWIYNSQGQILLQKRSPKKLVHPNVWDVAVAGHVEAGDSLENTLVREAEEELGLNIKAGDINFLERISSVDKVPPGWMNRVYIYTYLMELDVSIKSLTIDKEELSEIRWVNIEDLETELKENKQNFHETGLVFFPRAIAAIKKELGRD